MSELTAISWTAADQAELDVLVDALVRGFFAHRERCRVCAAGGPWCEHARRALDALLDWRRFRLFLSRAQALRREFDEFNVLTGGDRARAA